MGYTPITLVLMDGVIPLCLSVVKGNERRLMVLNGNLPFEMFVEKRTETIRKALEKTLNENARLKEVTSWLLTGHLLRATETT